MDDPDLARLHELVHAAQAYVERPWEPGETERPITFFTDHLEHEGWRLGWALVAELRVRYPELFGLYGEEHLHRSALDLMLAAGQPLRIDEIGGELRADISDIGDWLVVTPLANVSLERAWAPVGPRAILRRARDIADDDDAADLADAAAEHEVFKYLGDRAQPAPTQLRFSSGRTIDTGRTVSLISVERGTPPVAIETARAKATYALATWSVLALPADWHLMPDLGVWSPQPSRHQQACYKRLEAGSFIAKERTRGGSYREWRPYELPDDSTLRVPFEAFERLDQRAAQALLSGTAAWYSGSRVSRSQLSERLRDVRAAIECLCEPPIGGADAFTRWDRLAKRFGVWDQLSANRAYTDNAISSLQRRVTDARNISAHGADAALIDLGWTGGDRTLKWGGVADATDLAAPALHRDLGPMLFAVGEALRGAWSELRQADFDDDVFESLFA